MKVIYNLSVRCVGSVTIFGCISDDKSLLLKFLQHHDHEGSSIYLVKRDAGSDDFIDIDDPVEVYRELSS